MILFHHLLNKVFRYFKRMTIFHCFSYALISYLTPLSLDFRVSHLFSIDILELNFWKNSLNFTVLKGSLGISNNIIIIKIRTLELPELEKRKYHLFMLKY